MQHIMERIRDISIEHCSKDANQASHELARRAMQSKQYYTWDGEFSSFILGFVINDI